MPDYMTEDEQLEVIKNGGIVTVLLCWLFLLHWFLVFRVGVTGIIISKKCGIKPPVLMNT